MNVARCPETLFFDRSKKDPSTQKWEDFPDEIFFQTFPKSFQKSEIFSNGFPMGFPMGFHFRFSKISGFPGEIFEKFSLQEKSSYFSVDECF